LTGLEGTHAVVLTAPRLFTALLRRDPWAHRLAWTSFQGTRLDRSIAATKQLGPNQKQDRLDWLEHKRTSQSANYQTQFAGEKARILTIRTKDGLVADCFSIAPV
jgi:hypothetical protein